MAFSGCKLENLKVTDQGKIVTLTLDRALKKNALTGAMMQGISDICEILKRSPAETLILDAEGDHFCAGADISWMKSADHKTSSHQLSTMLSLLDSLPQFIIAKVKGAVFGGGVGLAALADCVFADPKTRFCFAEVKLGLVPATISPYVMRAIGARQAGRYFTTAEIFSAERAFHMGLVHEISTDIDPVLAALKCGGPLAKRAAKQLVRAPECDKVALLAELRSSPEAQEGLAAFLETRQPKWSLSSEL